MALVVSPAAVDTEGHIVATRYEHTGATYTARSAICALKDTVVVEAAESSGITCEACAARAEGG